MTPRRPRGRAKTAEDARARAALTTESPPALRMAPLTTVHPSSANPRKAFGADQLAELTASIRQDGVLQPLLVRPAPPGTVVDGDGDDGEHFEIVAGERRWRAAGDAGLTHVPIVVRQMSDVEVRRAMVTENIQRADLTPLEEAAGYRALLDVDPDATPDLIADLVGRSKSWVFQRLQLLKLRSDAMAALDAGRISAGHAVELARLEPGVQRRALDWLEQCDWRLSVREIQRWIGHHVRVPVPAGCVPVADQWTVSGEQRGKDVLAADAFHEFDGDAECAHAVDAMVALGSQRGRRMRICPRTSRCEQHWGEHFSGLRARAETKKKWEAERQKRDRQWERDRKRAERWRTEILPDLHAAVAEGTWPVDVMIQVVLEVMRSEFRHHNVERPPGLEPLHEAAWLAIFGGGVASEDVVRNRLAVLGLHLDRRGRIEMMRQADPDVQTTARTELAEAPASRTQSSATTPA